MQREMKFCTNCGAKTEDENQRFCKSCGFTFESKEELTTIETKEKEVQQTVRRKLRQGENTNLPKQKPMKKWPIFTVLSLVVILGIVHLSIKSYVNPTKVVEAIDEDFQNEKKKEFLAHFEYSSKLMRMQRAFMIL